MAGQETPEVAGDAEAWDGQEDKSQAEEKADYIHSEEMSCQPQSLKDAGQGSVQVEEGADKSQGTDEVSCQRAVKKGGSRPCSQQNKAAHAADAHQAAVFDGAQDCFADGVHIAQGVILRDDGQEEYRHGTGQGIGKEDKGHGHAGEYAVYT